MKSKTLQFIEALKHYYGDKWDDYEYVAKQTLINALSNRVMNGVQFSSLVDEMRGIFPLDLLRLLREMDINVLSDDSTTGANRMPEWTPEEILPPPHQANYEWRYTDDSANYIADMLAKDLAPDAAICCLGSPSVAVKLLERSQDTNITLLDINEPLVTRVSAAFANTCFKGSVYDAQEPVSNDLIGSYDCIVMNPPWYLDYYELFFERAISLGKQGSSTIIVPLFQPLTRHTAISDLDTFRKTIEQRGCFVHESLGYVEFDMPTFERIVFECNKIPTTKTTWRNAELISIDTTNALIPENTMKNVESIKWSRVFQPETGAYYVVDTYRLAEGLRKTLHVGTSVLHKISRKDIKNIDIIIWDNENNIMTLERD